MDFEFLRARIFPIIFPHPLARVRWSAKISVGQKAEGVDLEPDMPGFLPGLFCLLAEWL